MKAEKVGAFIETLRKEAGYSQQELASNLHVDKSTVCKWEKGRGFPDVALFPVIASMFNVSVDELMNGERSDNKRSNVGLDDNYGLTDEQYKVISESIIKKRRERNFFIFAVVIASAIFLFLMCFAVYSILADIPLYNLDTWLQGKRDDYYEKNVFGSVHKDVDFLHDGYDLPTYAIDGYELYKVDVESFFVSAKYKNDKGEEYAFSCCFYVFQSVHSAAMNGEKYDEMLDIGDYKYWGNGNYTNAYLVRDGISYMIDGIGNFIPDEECRKIFESIVFTEYRDEWVREKGGEKTTLG